MSWYVKRSMLLKVYVLTEIYMLADKSNNYEETWVFLERRIEEMITAQNILSQVGPLGSSIGTGIMSILSIISPKNLNMDDSYIKYMQQ